MRNKLLASASVALSLAVGYYAAPTMQDDPMPGLAALSEFAVGWKYPGSDFERLADGDGVATGGYIKKYRRMRPWLLELRRTNPDMFNAMTFTAGDSVTWAIAAWPDSTMRLSLHSTHYVAVQADSNSAADLWFGRDPQWVPRANTSQIWAVYALGDSNALVSGSITTTYDQLFICRDQE